MSEHDVIRAIEAASLDPWESYLAERYVTQASRDLGIAEGGAE